ncbi:MAG: hypothetical protein MJZ93_07080 [Paludibacteraceae bacterium]|nr:hypothetical protein [Paludibacteraceae bacterium]
MIEIIEIIEICNVVARTDGIFAFAKKSFKHFVTSEYYRTFAARRSAAFGIAKYDLSLLSFA